MRFRPLSLAEQVAAHLRMNILQGAMGRTIPGVHQLARELGVHHTTAEEALQILEKEKLLIPQGRGRPRLISAQEHSSKGPSIRVGILPYEESNHVSHHLLLELQHKLRMAGHTVSISSKSLHDLGMNVKRVADFVQHDEADAWVVMGGSRAVLKWFEDQPLPAMAVFGRRRGIQIASAGPDKLPSLLDAVDRLVELGHRRIAILLREEHRKPKPGFFTQALLDAMQTYGLPTGPYSLPDWQSNTNDLRRCLQDLRRCLDSLFRTDAPSALILDEAVVFNVAQQHLARGGILAPQHVSLVCAEPDRTFAWYHPSVAHIHWDSRKIIRSVAGWVDNVARGKKDDRQDYIVTEFVEGGTMGPAPGPSENDGPAPPAVPRHVPAGMFGGASPG